MAIVAIVGRPNVGKSTLFNRLIRERLSIEEDTPGVTRDRIYADAEWLGRTFTLIDTGGMIPDDTEELTRLVTYQARLAMAEADVIVFVLDTRSGLTATDRDIADMLRRVDKPVIICANKVETLKVEDLAVEFYSLGLGEPVAVSAAHGLGTGDLLDAIVAHLPPAGESAPETEQVIRTTVIGRPNVGKSSLVNRLLGQERMIVSDIPGTTRDAVDAMLEHDGVLFRLVDTAGLRRKSRVSENIEYYSVVRSLRAIQQSDVALMLLDATEGVTEQDKRIAGYADENGKGLVLIVNKWDLIEKDDRTMRQFEERLDQELPFLSYAPRLFISALTGQRVQRVLTLVQQVFAAHTARLSTADLNRVVGDATATVPPPAQRGRRLKISYVTQGATRPPQILFFCNDPALVPDSYRRYLESQIREAFPLQGTPLRLSFRAKS